MTKMLITGVSGMLGSNLAYYFRDKYDILGLYHSHSVALDGIACREADLLSADEFKQIVHDFSPQVVIHCASLTDVDFCENNRELTDQVNVSGTSVVAQSLAGSEAMLIYISSDSVYDGVKGNFAETDPVGPVNYYGLCKYRGELEAAKHENYLALRTNIFGWNVQDKLSIGEWVIASLEADKRINGFVDAYFSSIYTLELARIMELAISSSLKGVYNCASSNSMSKHDFAVYLADQLGLDTSLIDSISIDDFGLRAKRGKNLSLNVSKLAGDLKKNLPTVEQSIEALCRDWREKLPEKITNRNYD